MKRIIFIAVFLILAAVFMMVRTVRAPEAQVLAYHGTVEFKDGRTIMAEIADTEQSRRDGLSNRDPIGDDYGMLFLFETYAQYGFWMKDMRFPIDIIWIDGETIVDISHEVPNTPTGLPVIKPKASVNRVLEVRSGFAKDYGVEVGDKLKIEFP